MPYVSGFESYKRQRRAPSTDPFVTIQKKGTFALNQAAYDALAAPKTVELLYDRDEQLIAIRKVTQGFEYGLNVRQGTNSRVTWQISGKGFLKFYGVHVSRAVRRPARIENGMLVIDLNDPGVTATPGRQKEA
jgi:hypothetical protein